MSLFREKVQILSEFDRTERRYNESVRRRYSRGRGGEPVIGGVGPRETGKGGVTRFTPCKPLRVTFRK